MPVFDPAAIARANFEASCAIQQTAAATLSEVVARAALVLVECYQKGGTVFAFGNGGSAAEAQHLVGELVGRFKDDRRPLGAVVLPTDLASATCIANDFSHEEIFARPLEALARPGDVAFGLTTSGRSANVLKAMAAAKARGLRTIALIGAGESPLDAMEVVVRAPSTATARIQEVHTVVIHALVEIVELELFGRQE